MLAIQIIGRRRTGKTRCALAYIQSEMDMATHTLPDVHVLTPFPETYIQRFPHARIHTDLAEFAKLSVTSRPPCRLVWLDGKPVEAIEAEVSARLAIPWLRDIVCSYLPAEGTGGSRGALILPRLSEGWWMQPLVDYKRRVLVFDDPRYDTRYDHLRLYDNEGMLMEARHHDVVLMIIAVQHESLIPRCLRDQIPWIRVRLNKGRDRFE
jgi:hypothetical protein